MLGTILNVVKVVLGLGEGATLANKVGGVVTNIVSLPVLIWLAANSDKTISFETSYGFLALVVAVAYLVLEVLRRSRPGGGV